MASAKQPLTPAERSLRARLAAHTRWQNASLEDREAQGRVASEGLIGKFERELDPDGVLDPAERRLRATNARNAHMARLALQSAKKRRSGAAEPAGGVDDE